MTYIQPEKGDGSGAEAASEAFSSIMQTLEGIGESAIGVLKQFLQLPLSSPVMAGVTAILINDLFAHTVDFRNWRHQELVCLDCANLTVNSDGSVTDTLGNVLGVLQQGFLTFQFGLLGYIISNSMYAAHHANSGSPGAYGSPNPTGMHQAAYVWVPGIITNAANLQIAAIVLTGFGTSEVGTLLDSLGSFTALVKGNTPSASVTTSSLQTLGVPIVSDKAAKNPGA